MLTHFSISQQGQRHILNNIPCQDYSASQRVYSGKTECEIVIAAVADGVGSCEYSQYGSQTAVCSFMDYIVRTLTEGMELTDENILNLLRSSFHHALSCVETEACERELPFPEFDTTLTGLLYDGHSLWYGHIGDDGIVALYTDGTYEMITQRHKGEEAHSLFPLREQSLWQFGKAEKDVASCVLMTDGVLDYCVDTESMHNRVYFPFLEPALTDAAVTDEDAETQKKNWEEYLSGQGDYSVNFRDSVTDDISFAVVQNSESVRQLPRIDFDFDKWDADTAKRKEELDNALYADYRAYKAGIYRNPAKPSAEPSVESPVKFSVDAPSESSRTLSAESFSELPDDMPINDFMPKGYIPKRHTPNSAGKNTVVQIARSLGVYAKNLLSDFDKLTPSLVQSEKQNEENSYEPSDCEKQ